MVRIRFFLLFILFCPFFSIASMSISDVSFLLGRMSDEKVMAFMANQMIPPTIKSAPESAMKQHFILCIKEGVYSTFSADYFRYIYSSESVFYTHTPERDAKKAKFERLVAECLIGAK